MPSEKTFSIILAAGAGTRMRAPGRHKVCFEVGGVPAILRALQGYAAAGVDHHVIVVGQMAGEVMAAVGERFPNATFALQPEPLGTGHAAKCGARVLQDAGYQGRVLLVAGDKIVEPVALRRLTAEFDRQHCDLAFLVGPKEEHPHAGRVIPSHGEPVAIVETSEVKLSRLVAELQARLEDRPEWAAAELLALIGHWFPDQAKARKACGELYTFLTEQEIVQAGRVTRLLDPLRELTTVTIWREGRPQTLSAAEAEELSAEVNLSVYLCRAPVLYQALGALARGHAQQEEFLTDIVQGLAAHRRADGAPQYRVTTVPVAHSDEVLSFNTPEELAEIERIIRRREAAATPAATPVAVRERGRCFRPIQEWYRLLQEASPELQAHLRRIYGDDSPLCEAKRKEYLRALHTYRAIMDPDGTHTVALVRTPGRLNLLGRHIDHRGGCTNVIAINEEIIMVASARDDDQVHLYNTQAEQFTHGSFSVAAEISNLDWSDWLTCVNSPKTLSMVSNGHWTNYAKASALRLQERFRDLRLRGANIVAHGTIPIGSGLSSSSAVVVGAAEVLIAINDLPVQPSLLVDLCGEGEWFVGTRGGSADHAAIKFARRGEVAHVSFFPFEVKCFVPFFSDHALVLCQSGVEAKKSEGARETFNRKVLGYVVGEILFEQAFPDFAPSIHHLRDITIENLGVELAELYAMLKRLPQHLTREALFAQYGPFAPEDNAKLRNILTTLREPEQPFEVRGVVLYGLAECRRSERCVDLLRQGDADGLGRLWSVSHDGDRVARHDECGEAVPFQVDVSDAALDRLIADLRSGDPRRVQAAQLHLQPGSYACSTPEIDHIVDLSLAVPGVKGAQISGAGLGGCVMILVHNDSVEPLLQRLAESGLAAAKYTAVEGADLLGVA